MLFLVFTANPSCILAFTPPTTSHSFRLPNTQHLLTTSWSLRSRRTEWPELAFPLTLLKCYNLSFFCLYRDTFCWQFPQFLDFNVIEYHMNPQQQ